DALSRLLVAMRPSLGDSLYSAWENLSVTSSQPCCVYALRTRASVFGHNAPLKPVTDAQTGRVVNTEEWTLFRTSGVSNERFTITIGLNPSDKTITTQISLSRIDSRGNFTAFLGNGLSNSRSYGSSPVTFIVPLTTPDNEEVVV